LNLSTKEPYYIGIEEGNAADSLLAIIGPAGTDRYAEIIALKVQLHLQQQLKKLHQQLTATPVTQEASTDGQRILASPLAKKIASDKGIQLTQVKVLVKMDVS
jgi:pyruvate dehydrogenase E2 component (dihydrolipoamide acetyltransferase)